jgi:hypothetical protein
VARFVAVAAPERAAPPAAAEVVQVETGCPWWVPAIRLVEAAAGGRMMSVGNPNRAVSDALCRYRPAVDWLSSPPCSRIHPRTISMADNSLNRHREASPAWLQISHGLPMPFSISPPMRQNASDMKSNYGERVDNRAAAPNRHRHNFSNASWGIA